MKFASGQSRFVVDHTKANPSRSPHPHAQIRLSADRTHSNYPIILFDIVGFSAKEGSLVFTYLRNVHCPP